MTVYRFQSILQRAVKVLPCPGCGRRVRRQKTFTETVNPFNQNPKGMPKTKAEIQASLRDEADAWKSQAEHCTACADAEGVSA